MNLPDKLELGGNCKIGVGGVRGIFATAATDDIAEEIVRRWNAHAGLVEALGAARGPVQAMVSEYQDGQDVRALKLIDAALSPGRLSPKKADNTAAAAREAVQP